jgi:hypothetical protein
MQGQQTVNDSRGYMDRPILALPSVRGCAGPHRLKVARQQSKTSTYMQLTSLDLSTNCLIPATAIRR